MDQSGAEPNDPNIDAAVLFIWGNEDPAAGHKTVELQDQFIKGPYQKVELDAGHWLLETRTDEVIDAVLAHIGSATVTSKDSQPSNQH